jgi:3-methyladenine DNA glycosylase AlkD
MQQGGKPEKNEFLDNYLGSKHPRYEISMPVLRKIAKNFIKEHKDLDSKNFSELLTSLTEGKSFTEKCLTGILLDYATPEMRSFNPILFEKWLKPMEGWAEVDTLCTGYYAEKEIINRWKSWKPLLKKFSNSNNIHFRRASLVLLCTPLRKSDNKAVAEMALTNIRKLKREKEVLITKAISWVLRCMIVNHREEVEYFLKEEKELPPIAVRETLKVLTTGKKTGKVKTKNA